LTLPSIWFFALYFLLERPILVILLLSGNDASGRKIGHFGERSEPISRYNIF